MSATPKPLRSMIVAYAIWTVLWATILSILTLGTEALVFWLLDVHLIRMWVFVIWTVIVYFGTQVFSYWLLPTVDSALSITLADDFD